MAKILVVDDDELLRTFAAECLRAAGHEVLTAEDGEQGLALASSEKPALVITDLMMPGVHGFGVVEALRNNRALATIKIIVSSLKSYASDKQLAKNAGADRFLPKPYAPDALIAMVAELLGGSAIQVRFWGTRWSIATPGLRTARYGGNTSCTEVRCGDQILVSDAGTGIRELGNALLQEFGKNPIRAHIFVGHTHWDHIQGFPFFVPGVHPWQRDFHLQHARCGKTSGESIPRPNGFRLFPGASLRHASEADLRGTVEARGAGGRADSLSISESSRHRSRVPGLGWRQVGGLRQRP